MAELLIEFLSEEIPARMQRRAADELRAGVVAGLEDAHLSYEEVRVCSTPRRLVLAVDGLPVTQPDRSTERKGPRTDAPAKAIDGFLSAAGVTLDDCETREDKKGAYYVAVIHEKGRATADVLTELVTAVARAIAWPKSMRWGATRFRWVRPLHNILAIFDGKPLPGSLDLEGAGLTFSAQTSGHRFLAPEPFEVSGWDDYAGKLRDAHVVADPAAREAAIGEGLDKLAGELGLAVRHDPALLSEVAGLIEWPVVLAGDIDSEFMELPAEVLTTSMRTHQKYFSFETMEGALAPKFGFVANMVAADGGAAIVAGNERVLRARLSDAKYFWDQDRKTRLEDRVPELANIVFHAKLGSLGDKVQRIQALAVDLAGHIPQADRDLVRSAATLAKADLVTGMVGEFPELQGTMGRYYALAEGESPAVADAVAEHYAPVGPADGCPSAPVSVVVSLADKLDTLVGFWSINEKPTGSKDPYALRRAALGVIRLILENDLRLPLGTAFAAAGELHKLTPGQVSADLLSFFIDRLKVHLRDDGVPHDHVAAVFGSGADDDLCRLVALVRSLGAFIGSDDGANLLTAYRRAANIVRAEQRKDGDDGAEGAYDPGQAAADESGAEADLWAKLESIEEPMRAAIAAEDFAGAMAFLAQLRAPVDRFFEQVTVNVDDSDLRRNRLRLLSHVQRVMDHVADFSSIEG